MRVLDRLAALDQWAAKRGWIGSANDQNRLKPEIREEMMTAPLGWVAISAVW